MIATFSNGHVDRIVVGEPDSAEYARLLEWRQQTPGLTFEYPDFHRLQLEHWVWSRLQPTPRELRVLDIGVYDRRDWVGPSYRTLGADDTAADIHGDMLTPGLLGEACWDVVICTEVLEHCEDPMAAVRAIHASLVPGGLALLTSPFLWPDHHTDFYPDYWRFTEQAWRLLCRPFSAVSVKGCHWSTSGAAAYHLLRQAEGWGFAGIVQGSTGYLVEATK